MWGWIRDSAITELRKQVNCQQEDILSLEKRVLALETEKPAIVQQEAAEERENLQRLPWRKQRAILEAKMAARPVENALETFLKTGDANVHDKGW